MPGIPAADCDRGTNTASFRPKFSGLRYVLIGRAASCTVRPGGQGRDIRLDSSRIRTWLRGQSQDGCTAAAVRAALQVFPFVTRVEHIKASQEKLALATARAILTAGASACGSISELRAAARAARSAVNAAPRATANSLTLAARIAAEYSAAAACFEADAVSMAAQAIESAHRALPDTEQAMLTEARAKAREILERPLWKEGVMPDALIAATGKMPDILTSGPEWEFWQRWFDSFVVGTPLDWGLQQKIALLPEADWRAGAEHIAGRIADLEASLRPSTTKPE